MTAIESHFLVFITVILGKRSVQWSCQMRSQKEIDVVLDEVRTIVLVANRDGLVLDISKKTEQLAVELINKQGSLVT